MWSIINLVWFLFLAFLVLRVCYMLMKNQVVALKPKARVVYPYVAPKRPSAFDPADEPAGPASFITADDKVWLNTWARIMGIENLWPLNSTEKAMLEDRESEARLDELNRAKLILKKQRSEAYQSSLDGLAKLPKPVPHTAKECTCDYQEMRTIMDRGHTYYYDCGRVETEDRDDSTASINDSW